MNDEIYTNDCFDQLPKLDANSVHAVVTDPPYGLAFMGRSWDDFEPKEYQEWCEKWATECLRVLKPGGHLLAFSGNRTHHRLMSGIEDAGYEIRDCITWHYGSGFPKALDVSKAIDKRKRKELIEHLTVKDLKDAGIPDAERTHQDWIEQEHTPSDEHWQKIREWVENSDKIDRPVIGRVEFADNTPRFTNVYGDGEGQRSHDITEPATEQAKQWDGFKSALKPATEFVCVARSPLAEDTIAENVVAHGTGALNIDACRIDNDINEVRATTRTSERIQNVYGGNAERSDVASASAEGRYPSNVVFDAQQADVLDDKVGELDAGARTPQMDAGSGVTYGEYGDGPDEGTRVELSSGGPSRYFYTSKASKAERTLDGKIDNAHPTVKPIDLMEWLVQLATAEEQIVLDPFAGSGTTCKAAKNKNRQFIGIEQQAKWADVARVRSGLPPDDHSHIRSDDEQHGLEQYH